MIIFPWGIGFPLSSAIRLKVAMALSLLPDNKSKRGLSGSHCVTHKSSVWKFNCWYVFLRIVCEQTYEAATKKDGHRYGGQAEQPPPAQSGHYQQGQENLEHSTNGPEGLLHTQTHYNQKGIYVQFIESNQRFNSKIKSHINNKITTVPQSAWCRCLSPSLEGTLSTVWP